MAQYHEDAFFTNAEQQASAQDWYAGATRHSGSWWEHWKAWLLARSGSQKAAPPSVGNSTYTPLAEAPGTYVYEQEEMMLTYPGAANINGTHVYVAIRQGDGSGPPLLLINGIGANLEVFDPFIDALEKAGRKKIGTIRFDVPGVGGSPPTLFPLRFRGLARLVAQLLDAVGQQEVDVLGISWGGGLAQQFAHQYPQRCRRLVLVATSTGAISVPGRLSVLAKLLSPRRYLQPSYLATIAPTLYGGMFRQRPDLARAYAHLVRAPHGLGYYRQLLAGVGWTSLPWLHQLRQPTLILAGNDDPIVPPVNARIMARLIPHARLHIINEGHLLLLTEREQVAPLVYHFLREE